MYESLYPALLLYTLYWKIHAKMIMDFIDDNMDCVVAPTDLLHEDQTSVQDPA